MLYLDTSALLPYYRPEALSQAVQQLLQSVDTDVIITDLVSVELASVLARLVRMQELSENDALAIESAFAEDVAAHCYSIKTIGPKEFYQARRWLLSRKTALRTLDSLHLAAALSFRLELVTADKKLAEAADIFSVPYRLL